MTSTPTSLTLSLVLLLGGCSDKAQPDSPKPVPPASKPVAPLIEKQQVADWCPEHGVPESICTRCNHSLTPAFKAKGDWCKKHDLPDSQCFVCHPELEAKFKALAPSQGPAAK